MKTYAQLLKDPRWQKKRLEILERDEFSCQDCGDTKNTLHIHHCYYSTGKKPWEYENNSLITLCESCHELEADALEAKIMLTNALSKWGWLKNDFAGLAQQIESANNLSRMFGYIPDVVGNILINFPYWLSLYNNKQLEEIKGE